MQVFVGEEREAFVPSITGGFLGPCPRHSVHLLSGHVS